MAEIPIERKPRRSAGPLMIILILLALVAAGWYWWTNYGNDDTTNPTTTSVTPLIQSASVSVPSVLSQTFRRV